ncbi:FKBP-type peptidyl-prolyl cis-trans isomerase [Flavobacterium resistens]|uniref:Peptidyl-prolyl cis-trans isomerase n=1 Tax=Flavobacterium resistens TaxID=443612 RepID=A0A521DU78_9FLAO|nr:FKBP-type peptidyl-prolyl cis-trans isomerase [Flavobacterium resistens]MRX68156.1 peptidylprolyl isomerase [Flavobacterium resistens]SMO75279.1 FKBP-type peptidyl-prolyl cis-trans isomerase [Flavobacterium resistens]
MKHFLSALFALTLFISCTSSDKNLNTPPKDYSAENDKEIIDYLAKNNLTAQKTASGLYYIITEPGTGKQPTATSSVTVAYKGYLTNKKTFDESVNGATFPLNRVIAGWTEGIPLFKEGGSGVLLIPAHLAYGDNNVSTIPAGSVLIFDVKLISVN